jgi:hypothetical protein
MSLGLVESRHGAGFVAEDSRRSTVSSVESQGLIEFRYADGGVVTGDYAAYATRWGLTTGDELEYDGGTWLMYDREDRGGITVHLFSPVVGLRVPEASRARRRGRS